MATKKAPTKKPAKARRLVRQPEFVSTLTGTVHWKDVIFFDPYTGSMITHNNKPLVHARLCQWNRKSVEEKMCSREPRDNHRYITVLHMIGVRTIDYMSLDNAEKRLRKANAKTKAR